MVLLMDCFNYLNPNQKPIVYIKNSLLGNAGLGVFAKTDIKKNTPIIIYYGEKITNKEIMSLYLKDNKNYQKNISPYLRSTGIPDTQVNGKKSEKTNNINLKGYLVNDSFNITNIDDESIKKYLSNKNKNNLSILETKDFPIYYSIRDIKEDEELYVSYGLGYWLLQCNCKPENIREIYEKFTLIESN